MEKSINIFTSSLGTNEKTLRAFAAIKKKNLSLLDKLITESKKNLISPEFEDDVCDIVEFGKANRLDLQNPVNITTPPNLNPNGPQHPYELDVLAAAIYYATEESQDAFDRLLDYAKIAIEDENKLKNVISDAFWIAALYGRLKIIEKLIPEKPELRNLARWYIPEVLQQSVSQLSNSVTTTTKPTVRPIVPVVPIVRVPSVCPTISNNTNNKVPYQVNCDAFQIAVIANNMDIVKALLYFNFPCNNVGMILYPPNTQALPPYIQGHDAQKNTALELARYMGNKELQNMLLRSIYLQDAKQAFAEKNYPLATSCFSLACAFDPSMLKSLPEISDSKKLWLDNLSFLIEYLHTQVENAVDQATGNKDSQDYHFVLDFIKIFANLFSTNNDANYELLYKEFINEVADTLYAYNCSSNATPYKLFESNEAKEAFFNKHSFFSDSSLGKTHGAMQGKGNSSVNSTNMGFFATISQNNLQPNNNNSNDGFKAINGPKM